MNARGSDQYIKVLFELEQDDDGGPPAATETLWAVRVGDGLFQIDNISFFAHGIAVNDIVSATPEEKVFRYEEVVQPSGHSTIRLIISETSEVQARMRSLIVSAEPTIPRAVVAAPPQSQSSNQDREVLLPHPCTGPVLRDIHRVPVAAQKRPVAAVL
ncbi:MAG TPA: DUF4265 domain-containing protein [Myxococcaceae bacterium]|nr:DUF4265 domain-containing protein [Myxococcaceae bacterium]